MLLRKGILAKVYYSLAESRSFSGWSHATGMDDIDQKYSDRLFWMVQTVFGVVLGGGLTLHRDVLLAPFASGNSVAVLTIVLIYGTTVWSWIDFSHTSLLNPYRPREILEKWRMVCDLLIVILYAGLWFSVAK